MALYEQGRDTYLNKSRPVEAVFLNESIRNLCTGAIELNGTSTIYIVTDPLEDADDTALINMIAHLFENSGLKFNLILSGGFKPPSQRLEFVKTIIPGIQDFGILYRGFITFYPDGHIVDAPFDAFVMCGPCRSNTFKALCKWVMRAVTMIGTLDSGHVNPATPLPVNSKFTDVDGLLTPDPATWNSQIDFLCSKVIVTALNPEIGRLTEAPSIEWFAKHPVFLHQQNQARLLNLTSRPPPFMGDRLHIANCTVIGQWPEPSMNESRFNHGAEIAQAYLSGLPEATYEKLKVCVTYVIITATLHGAVYLPGKFGSPTKNFNEFLTQESIDELINALDGCGTPMYDVAGFVMLARTLCLM